MRVKVRLDLPGVSGRAKDWRSELGRAKMDDTAQTKAPAQKGKGQCGKGQGGNTARVLAPLTGRPRGATDFWGSVDFPLKAHVSPHGQITAVSMMKDEGPYVIEWVAHHLAVGFTDLVVYTNDCADGTDDMLIRLEALGLAHHRRNVIPEGIRPQPSALNHAQEEPVVGLSDWVMVFDADEFVSIRYGDGTLDDLIAAAKTQDANGVVVTWRIFGSGGVVDWSRAPVSEQYLMAAPTEWNKGWGVKTLFTFDAEHWKLGIHRPKMKTRHIKTDFPDRVKWLTGSGNVMEDYFKFRGWRSITRTVGYDWVQLNHYAVKSVDSYAIRKLRGNVNNKKDKYNSDYWSLQDRNEVRDDTMLRYTERRDKIIAQLLSDPELHRLHHAAVARAEARLNELRQTEAYHALVADLARASDVPISQIVAKPPQARDKEKIAALMTEVEKSRNAKAKQDRIAEVKTPVEQVPMGGYVPGLPDVSADVAVEWVQNHEMNLPLDGRIFPPSALGLIRLGKFERGLARKLLQVLPKGAAVLEIGAALGFQALHLAWVRPDLRLTLQEDNASLRTVMGRIMAHNGRAFSARLVLSHVTLQPPDRSVVALVRKVQPGVLILADPRLSPEVLAATLPHLSPLPQQIILYGRLLETWHQRLAEVEEVLTAMNYTALDGFDAAVAREFRLGDRTADAGQALA